MRIGIPKETILEEKRVAIAPAGVDQLVRSGHTVYVETGAGLESHFTDDELAQTKAVIKNQLLETIDTSRGVVEVLYHNVVSHKELLLDDWIAKMDQVTKDEVMNVAKKIQLDTIYFLTGKEVAQ